ncbi:hypothetical protein KUH03_02370 [Sphingobacterium sp. E70]|uniref:hypothetical protein n=1 Tax=Sphingobacterium sp. E70 TaxID=2853439 RepID=UPI00211CAEBA|nr:hypothetical protein [Sphingobacterium sp. E70]ULT25855.1 hypothetical protein KUH03_02370 [Sphingobacterium sp. E70]
MKEIADYSDFPKIAPVSKISGYDAFMQYIQLAKPFVEQGAGKYFSSGKETAF